jgi:hypothetical protein
MWSPPASFLQAMRNMMMNVEYALCWNRRRRRRRRGHVAGQAGARQKRQTKKQKTKKHIH